MRQRLPEWLGGAALTMALVMLFLPLAHVSVAAQTPAGRGTAAASGPAPKTAWGQPDLQGIWVNEFATPLERDPQNANKEFFTDQERAAIDDRASGNIGRNQRVERGTQKDVAGAYNAVFTSAKPAGRRTSLIVDPPNGRIPALTPQQQERDRIEREFRLALLQNTVTCKEKSPGCDGGTYGPPSPRRNETPPFYNNDRLNRHDNPEDESLNTRCRSQQQPDLNGFRRIVQGPDVIAIAVDTGQGQGYQRVVYLSGSHPPSHIQLRHGDSRGHFEGNVLVVETTNFSPKYRFRGAGENLKLVERFTRVDAKTLDYEVTLTDPTVWTAPWTIKEELTMQSDPENRIYYEPRCWEGNYGLPTMLLGARLAEKAFAEGRGPDPASEDTSNCVNALPE